MKKDQPSARFGHSQIVYENKVYIFGGWDGKHTLNDFWEFDPDRKQWTRVIEHTRVAPRYRHTAMTYNNFMVIFGGVDNSQSRYNDIHMFDFSLRIWIRVIVLGQSPSPRTFHRVDQIEQKTALLGNQMLLVGGFDGDKLNDLWSISLKELKSISPSTSLMPHKPKNAYEKLEIPDFSQSKMTPLKSKPEIRKKLNDTKGVWTKISSPYGTERNSQEPEERTGHSLIFDGEYLLVLGGVNSKSICLEMGSIDCFDFKRQVWFKRSTSGVPPSIRSSIQNCYLADKRVAIFFGGYFVDDFYNDCFSLDCERLTWSCLSRELIPITRRAYFTMNLCNDSIYIFGGRGKLQIFSCLFRLTYNQHTEELVAEEIISIGERPCERFGHCASVIDSSL